MAEIERKSQKIFGGGLSPSGNIAIYGSMLAGAIGYSSDLDSIQSPAWLSGLAGAVSPDKAPYLQDLNAIFYAITKQLAYIFQAGVAEWNSETEYFANKSFVVHSGTIYRAKTNSTNIEPNVTANWQNYWEEVKRWDSITEYKSSTANLVNGYPLNSVIDYVSNNGSVYKIRSLIDNNKNIPTPTNIRVSSSQTGTFYWELMNYGFMPGAIIPFAGSVIPNGWLLCDGSEVDKTLYGFLNVIIGDTYGISSDANKFKLPDFRNKTFWGGEKSEAGTEKEAGLPDHFHSVRYNQGGGGGIGGSDLNAARPDTDVYWRNSRTVVASGSNSIYGKSDTVQPPAIQTPFIIKY